jgi:hypothetical protein
MQPFHLHPERRTKVPAGAQQAEELTPPGDQIDKTGESYLGFINLSHPHLDQTAVPVTK